MAGAGNGKSKAQREFLRKFPRTGPGTRGGAMLRRSWHPVCLSEDLAEIPFAVRMLGGDLVAFRGRDGAVGRVGANVVRLLGFVGSAEREM